MLQLPSKAPRFSRAQIADIARGGKVIVRARKVKTEPIVKKLAAFERAVAEYSAALAIENTAASALRPHDALAALVYPMNVDGAVPTFSYCGPFKSARHIKDTVRKRAQSLRSDLPGARKRAKQSGGFQIERRQHLSSMEKELAALPGIESALLKAMRTAEARVTRIQRSVKYPEKQQATFKAHSRMWSVFKSLKWGETATPQGALALIELASVIVRTQAVHADVPEMLYRAWRILSERRAD